MVIIPTIITTQFPFIQNFTVTSFNYAHARHRHYLVITGTMDVLFTDEAREKFGYEDGNFYWFNEWWQNQVGAKYGPFRLVSITWTLIEHTETQDTLGFEVVLALRRGWTRWFWRVFWRTA